MPSRKPPESAAFGGRGKSWRRVSAGPAAGRVASIATALASSGPRRTLHRLARGFPSSTTSHARARLDWILQACVEVKGRSNTKQGGIASQRSVVLVTGMSGTGKSSALAGLARRGHQTVDTDDPGWIIENQTPAGPEPLWDLKRVGALLDRHQTGWLFIAGCVANQRALYDRFDAVALAERTGRRPPSARHRPSQPVRVHVGGSGEDRERCGCLRAWPSPPLRVERGRSVWKRRRVAAGCDAI
jgi:hypothetical protein